MYLIEREAELDVDTLGRILQLFLTSDAVRLLNSYDYYRGKQDILKKTASDTGKPCNKVVVNYCKPIVENYCGYLVGKPVTYSSEEDIQAILDVLSYNDEASENVDFLNNALIYGVAYECNYVDEESKLRFTVLDPREVIPVYDNTLSNNLKYVIRFYLENLYDEKIDKLKYIVEVYGDTTVKRYRSVSGFTSFELIDEFVHHFNQVPITVFKLNRDEESIFHQVISLQDAYNEVISAEVDDVDLWSDAYLVLKGCTADGDDLKQMKKNRVLVLDEGAEADYLVKSVNDTQVENILANLNDHIHKIANSPDLNDQEFNASTGIALKLKLTGLSNTAQGIKNLMTRALLKRVELICSILSLTEGESIWRDIDIIFSDNIPEEADSIAQTVNALRGLVSTETLLSQLPFIKDPVEEAKKVNEEKLANMELYSTGENTFEGDDQ